MAGGERLCVLYRSVRDSCVSVSGLLCVWMCMGDKGATGKAHGGSEGMEHGARIYTTHDKSPHRQYSRTTPRTTPRERKREGKRDGKRDPPTGTHTHTAAAEAS